MLLGKSVLVGSVAGEGMATGNTFLCGREEPGFAGMVAVCSGTGRLARAQSRKPPVEVRAESKAFSQGITQTPGTAGRPDTSQDPSDGLGAPAVCNHRPGIALHHTCHQ